MIRPTGHVLQLKVLAIVVLTLILSSCSAMTKNSVPKLDYTPDSIVILVGVTANQPQAQVPIEMQPIIEAGVTKGAPLTVIAVDGQPRVIFHISGYQVDGKNPDAKRISINRVQSELLAAVREAQAESSNSDLSSALSIAGDQAKADKAIHATIIVIDSGLSDKGYPNMTVSGTTAREPAEVVKFAAQHNELLALPRGSTVYLIGTGYGAGPQPQLTPGQRKNVAAIWKSFIEASGAKVELIPIPRTGKPPKSKYSAGIVVPSTLAQFNVEQHENELTASIGSDLLFEPDKWELLQSSKVALNDLVAFLKQNEGAIRVEGFTDLGPTSVPGGNQTLSQNRADSVKAYLVDNGIRASRISAIGRGIGGAKEPSPNNRRVTITIEQEPNQ